MATVIRSRGVTDRSSSGLPFRVPRGHANESQAGLLRQPGPRGCSCASTPTTAQGLRAPPSVPPSASAAAPCWLGRGQLASYSALPPSEAEEKEKGSLKRPSPGCPGKLRGIPRPVPSIFRKRNSGPSSGLQLGKSLLPRLDGRT